MCCRVNRGTCANTPHTDSESILQERWGVLMQHGQKYRKNARFVMDVGKHVTRLDRNDKAKLMHAAEAMERLTKRKGRRNGVLGQPAIRVLRALVFRFHGPSGLCCPSYTVLQRSTGLCRQSIATALKHLEGTRLLAITRRLVRVKGKCIQGSNLYSFCLSRVYWVGAKYRKRFSAKGRSSERVILNHNLAKAIGCGTVKGIVPGFLLPVAG